MSTVAIPAEAEFLTVSEAAALLRISRATAYRLVDAGELPAVRVGGQLRVDRVALLEQLQAGRVDLRGK
ncbi:MAG TPA: helix-turn-helix domain-containing protein [Solirubrobacteraceae bacterium]|nr:helix-turn-helix domain-containing protein [Solirubrobacteraceae bacterium]